MTEEKVVEMYESGYSSVKIGNYYNVPVYKIVYILKKNNVKMRSNKENSRKYTLDEDVFEKIDSEESAYWLGFIYADGYVSKRGYVGISLSSVDASHLEKFNIFLKSTYPIHTYKTTGSYSNEFNHYSRLLVRSDKLKKDLVSLGVLEQKTLLLSEPDIEDSFIRHFIRGYIDGDGSITGFIPLKDKSMKYSLKATGTKPVLNYILKNLGKANLKLYHKKGTHEDIYSFTIGGNNQLERILDYIYKDSVIFLDRKYQSYLEFKNSRLG